MSSHPAKFTYFKPSGKYYSEGQGQVPDNLWTSIFGNEERRKALMEANNGWPGMMGECRQYIICIFMDNAELAETPGYPLMQINLEPWG